MKTCKTTTARALTRLSEITTGLAALLATGAALAADAPAAHAPGAAVSATSPLNMVLGLLFLLALVALSWWFVKRTGGAQWGTSRAIRALASLPVGTRERVVLIEAGGKQLLIGVAPGRVALLHAFDEPVITDTGGGEDFASKIRQAMQHGLQR